MEKKIIPSIIILYLLTSFSFLGAQSSFYTTDVIQEIRIHFEQDNWPYLLDSLRYNGEELLLADVTVNGKKMEDVGVRYEEGRGFLPGRKRNSLYIGLDFIKKSQNHEGYRAFFLSNSLRDPSMVREVLGYEIARSYMPAPEANYAKVYVNDQYYGLLVNIEVIDASFTQKHFGDYTGNLFKSEPQLGENTPQDCSGENFANLRAEDRLDCYKVHFKAPESANWKALDGLAKGLKNENYKKLLNLDPTLWMLAFNNVMVNLDSYSGHFSDNYYLYQDQNGLFIPILGKLNFSFGSFKNTGIGSDLNLDQMATLSPLLHWDNPQKPLISELLRDELLYKIYLAHVRAIMRNHFSSGTYAERARSLQKLIEKDRLDDTDNRYTSDEFYSNLKQTVGENSKIPGLEELMDRRVEYLRKHPTMLFLPPSVVDIKVKRRERFSSKQINTFKIQTKVEQFPTSVRIYYRFNEGDVFSMAVMRDDGKHDDGTAGDEVFGVEIVPDQGQQKMQYYIMAENAKSVQFNPSNYMYDPHVADLIELNK